MRRRRFLTTTAGVSTALLAGCLGEDDPTVLDPFRSDVASEDLSYPANGERLPSVELPAPLHESTIATDDFVGTRETLITFVFTRCPGPCPTMTSTLAHVQAEAIDGGYADEVALMPITFDPEYDTPAVFEAFCRDTGADPHADNWFALRPETAESAEAVVQGEFGVWYEEVPMEESDHGDHGDHGEDEMTFAHANLILLANRDGYVERAYAGQPPTTASVIDDLETVRDAFV